MASTSHTPGREPGTPQGISPQGVEARSELARWISGADVFPADRAALLARAEEQNAPDSVIGAVRSLPERTFTTLAEVAETLGYGKEDSGQG
ncbi:DUF2795 domain-containing protein [Streptosporangium carneum]|uniref:DUF2795 domain-containing protein n=1 Tax=Streptosporangium carneum TaxID=47481 RepID=A0A9W6MGE1_9ACTN|nr:DUF2795 domain-containing protein [Streptosporangium carneum]GLK12808.1 hypothetical protein GCM10017600_62180 [Streptosporangium carneum]